MNKFVSVLLVFFVCNLVSYAKQGFFLGYKNGFAMKIDVPSALEGKKQGKIDLDIPAGINQFGNANPHNASRLLEPITAGYAEMFLIWGYRFPKFFSLGFSILLQNFIMPYITFDFKFSFFEEKKTQPYVFLSYVANGLMTDFFPMDFILGGGFDFFITDNLYILVESKAGFEWLVVRYYDDGVNTNPIWEVDKNSYIYGVFGITIGISYQFLKKNQGN